jgi:hypothetical protein
VLRLDTIVVKSGSLKHFASHCAAWVVTDRPRAFSERAEQRGGRQPVMMGSVN